MTLRLTQLFFFLLPFLFALSSLVPLPGGFDIHIARILPLILLGFLFWEAGVRDRKIHIPVNIISVCAVILFLWSLFSFFYSAVPTWTARKLFFLLTFAPLLIVLPTLWQWHGKAAVKEVLVGLVYGAGAISFVGVFQFFLQFPLSLDTVAGYWGVLTPFFLGGTFGESVATFNSWFVHIAGTDLFRAVAFFPDPHIFAYFTGMTLPLAWALFREDGARKFLIIALVILLANILTFSRGGEVALLAGVILALACEWKNISLPHKHGLFAMILIVAFVLVLPFNPLTNRFISSFDASDTSNSTRITLWMEALDTIVAKPIFGVGLGAYPMYVDPRADYRTPIYAHNTYLDVAVETGLVGLFFFLMLCGTCLTALFQKRESHTARYAMISLCIFLVHGFFDTPLFSVHIFPLLLLIISLAFFFRHYDTNTGARISTKRLT